MIEYKDPIGKMFEALDPIEQTRWEEFVKNHANCKRYVSGNGISVTIMADSIGGHVITMNCKCGVSENITNFDNW